MIALCANRIDSADRQTADRRSAAGRLPAFTLVEVLVVLVLISILASMVLTAVSGVRQTAAQARTRSIIATIDSVIQERWETYKYRPLAVDIPAHSLPRAGNIVTFEALAPEAARVRLNMIRDLQRMELPDRRSDIVNGTQINHPVYLSAVANPVIVNPATGRSARNTEKNARVQLPSSVAWYSNSHRPALLESYWRRVQATGGGWTEQYEGAECLYMIMATSFVGGAPALEMIPASNIGDLDNDGMPEILDGWGQPLEFIRWPSGYVDELELAESTMLDDFDPLRVDFSFVPTATTASTNPDYRTRSLRPLVISAGPDREFGIALHPQNSSGTQIHFRYHPLAGGSYQLMTWPVNAAYMGDERLGRSGSYPYVDPFLRTISDVIKPGAPLGDGTTRADNLTNYALTAE